ncbi:MAG: tRNA pseudouridine(55) synthase TruB [Alphaproteobacteria bacterium]|nr:tRNA pseudouridine(55) synthase TruB [Alphaproteobacteria bacterium]
MNKKIHIPVHGWLALDKPLGLTSTQALGRARRLLGGKKAGHGGTLDPLATGILPLAFGEATKLIPYVMDGDKEYEFTVTWGENRTTEDSEGAVTATGDARPAETAIRDILPRFIGDVWQTPPVFSAIKVQGERAYDLARAGEAVELAARQVYIDSFDLIDMPDADTARFRVSCGKGMYVRALARDMAAALGVCGYVSGLRRTKVGPFGLQNMCAMERLEELAGRGCAGEALLPLRAALDDIMTVNLTAAEAQTLRSGQAVMIRPQHGDVFDRDVIFTENQGVPVALVEPVAGELRVVRGFHFS